MTPILPETIKLIELLKSGDMSNANLACVMLLNYDIAQRKFIYNVIWSDLCKDKKSKSKKTEDVLKKMEAKHKWRVFTSNYYNYFTIKHENKYDTKRT